VSNVTNMREMFSNALAFNQPIDFWDVSNVEDVGFMFLNASSFNQPIRSWDVSKVTNMRNVFHCSPILPTNMPRKVQNPNIL